MKATYRVLLSLVLLSGIMAPLSYAGAKYGQPISKRTVTAITDILTNPKAYDGKLVTIEGTIATEASNGYWFVVKAKEGAPIYVDISRSGFAIPQHTGKKILVEGTVVIEGTVPMIQGRGVEVDWN
jgi:hypothetical protein